MADEISPPPLVLLDRIQRDPEGRIVGNRFEAALALYFQGSLSRAEMLAMFAVPPEMEADFDQFKAGFDAHPGGGPGVDERQAWMQAVHACVKLLQFGDITKEQFNTFTDMSLSTSVELVPEGTPA